MFSEFTIQIKITQLYVSKHGAGNTLFCICILCTNLLYPSKGTYLCCNVQSNVNNIGCNIRTPDPSCQISSGKVRSLILLQPCLFQVLGLSRFTNSFCIFCSLLGTIFIIAGLYSVLWGKANDGDNFVGNTETRKAADGSNNNISDCNIGIKEPLLEK